MRLRWRLPAASQHKRMTIPIAHPDIKNPIPNLPEHFKQLHVLEKLKFELQNSAWFLRRRFTEDSNTQQSYRSMVWMGSVVGDTKMLLWNLMLQFSAGTVMILETELNWTELNTSYQHTPFRVSKARQSFLRNHAFYTPHHCNKTSILHELFDHFRKSRFEHHATEGLRFFFWRVLKIPKSDY